MLCSSAWRLLHRPKAHSGLYVNVSLQVVGLVVDLYPEDCYPPGIDGGVIHDPESNVEDAFNKETAYSFGAPQSIYVVPDFQG